MYASFLKVSICASLYTLTLLLCECTISLSPFIADVGVWQQTISQNDLHLTCQYENFELKKALLYILTTLSVDKAAIKVREIALLSRGTNKQNLMVANLRLLNRLRNCDSTVASFPGYSHPGQKWPGNETVASGHFLGTSTRICVFYLNYYINCRSKEVYAHKLSSLLCLENSTDNLLYESYDFYLRK